MFTNVALRSTVAGFAAAAVVIGAYAWGHGSPASAAPSVSASASVPGATEGTAVGGVSVTGSGQVTGTPDLLRLQTSIDVTESDVASALQRANTTMAAVQKTFKAGGVAAADLQTSGLSIQPSYQYPGGAPKLVGYTVSENLSAVLRDLSKAGAVIDDAARAGGDYLRIGAATLDMSSDDALVAQARQRAFADAKAKAEAYARAAGRSLGPVTSINETQDTTPVPYKYDFAAAAAPSAAPVPIEAGTQDVTVNVSATWSLS